MRNVRGLTIGVYRSDSSGLLRQSSLFFYASFSSSFVSYDFNLLLRQSIKFIDELVDLAVGGLDLALQAGFPLWVVRG
jgi:hypothetical protein